MDENARFHCIFTWLGLDHVGRFEEICGSGRLPALKDLYFSFRFPPELENAWQSTAFGRSNKWPFDNIGCLTNECLVLDDYSPGRIPKSFLIVYKNPINVLLKYTRSLLNHSFANHAAHLHAVNQSHSIHWICGQVNEPDRIMKTFHTIRAGRSNAVCITFIRKRVRIPLAPLTFDGSFSTHLLLREPWRSYQVTERGATGHSIIF